MPLEAPQTQGDMLPQADVLNHVMIVTPTEWIEHLPTKNTKPGEKSAAIRVHVADFTADPHNPTVYRNVLWFGVITNSLKRQIGKHLASMMTQGQATQGNNPPWQLKSMLDDPGWANYLGAWLDNTDAGRAFQEETAEAVRMAQATPTTAPAVETAAPAAPPAPAAPAAPPAPPTVSAPAPAAPPAAPAAPAAPVAAPAANPAVDPAVEALLAAMPPEQQAAARAVLANQSKAAH
jgi:hypothetical protein